MKTKPRRPNLQALVDRFNFHYPVGTAVTLRKDTGTVNTVVTHRAQILSGHSAVAWFEGVSGCYSIEGDRVQLRTEASS